MWRIVHSPFGLHLAAIRENPRKARVPRRAGAPVSLHRVPHLGVLLRGRRRDPRDQHRPGRPELAYWTHSGELVFMTVLGGFANFFGPLVGAFSFIFLKSELMGATQYWRFFLGDRWC
jgi:branched-chain amino acid transport system permease protein